MIFKYLGLGDQGAFRRTCKRLDFMVFDTFGKTYFTDMRLMLTFESLQIGYRISQSRLAPFVKVLILGNERLPRPPPLVIYTFHPDEEDIYCKQNADDNTFEWTGRDVELLALVIRGLSSLHRYCVCIGNFRQTYRHEGMVDRPRSRGFRPILVRTGNPAAEEGYTVSPMSVMEYDASIMAKLLAALQKANRSPMELLVPKLPVLDSAYNIPPYLRLCYSKVLSELRFLQLCLRTQAEWVSERRLVRQEGQQAPCHTNTYHLRRFLSFCPKLQGLWLTWQAPPPYSPKGCFLQWLATPAPPSGPMEAVAASASPGSQRPAPIYSPVPLALPCLQDLRLANATISTGTMLRLIKKLGPRLQALVMDNVTLYNTTEDSNDPPPDDSVNPWSQCFLLLSSCVSDLFSYFFIRNLFFKLSNSPTRFYIRGPAPNGKILPISGWFRGSDIKQGLESLSDFTSQSG